MAITMTCKTKDATWSYVYDELACREAVDNGALACKSSDDGMSADTQYHLDEILTERQVEPVLRALSDACEPGSRERALVSAMLTSLRDYACAYDLDAVEHFPDDLKSLVGRVGLDYALVHLNPLVRPMRTVREARWACGECSLGVRVRQFAQLMQISTA